MVTSLMHPQESALSSRHTHNLVFIYDGVVLRRFPPRLTSCCFSLCWLNLLQSRHLLPRHLSSRPLLPSSSLSSLFLPQSFPLLWVYAALLLFYLLSPFSHSSHSCIFPFLLLLLSLLPSSLFSLPPPLHLSPLPLLFHSLISVSFFSLHCIRLFLITLLSCTLVEWMGYSSTSVTSPLSLCHLLFTASSLSVSLVLFSLAKSCVSLKLSAGIKDLSIQTTYINIHTPMHTKRALFAGILIAPSGYSAW